jgi:hypothetical protein
MHLLQLNLMISILFFFFCLDWENFGFNLIGIQCYLKIALLSNVYEKAPTQNNYLEFAYNYILNKCTKSKKSTSMLI